MFQRTSVEVTLLLSSRNCCSVTTSLPGESVLILRILFLSTVSDILWWSRGLDLVWLFRYWMGLLLLLDHASWSWSRLNSPLLWLWGLLWLLTAPALRINSIDNFIVLDKLHAIYLKLCTLLHWWTLQYTKETTEDAQAPIGKAYEKCRCILLSYLLWLFNVSFHLFLLNTPLQTSRFNHSC